MFIYDIFLKDCVPYGEEACRDAAKKLGLPAKTGNWKGVKGCYAYTATHKYAGTIYYSTGGSVDMNKAPLEAPAFRPKGFDCHAKGSLTILHDSPRIRL